MINALWRVRDLEGIVDVRNRKKVSRVAVRYTVQLLYCSFSTSTAFSYSSSRTPIYSRRFHLLCGATYFVVKCGIFSGGETTPPTPPYAL